MSSWKDEASGSSKGVGSKQRRRRVKKVVEESLRDIHGDDHFLALLNATEETVETQSGEPPDTLKPEEGETAEDSEGAAISTSVDSPMQEDDEFLYYQRDNYMSDQSNSSISSDGAESTSSDDEVESVTTHLRKWSLKHRITHDAVSDLLGVLHKFHPDLPKDSRTLLCTPRETKVTKLLNGDYAHLGVEVALLQRVVSGVLNGSSCVQLQVNFDGLPLFKSSLVEFWPILGRGVNLVDSRPFVIGVFCGTGKPDSLEMYLADYINEMIVLLDTGIMCDGIRYSVQVHSYVCDAPARAYIKCIKYHSGYSACERCTQEGIWDGRKICFESKASFLRTEQSFLARSDADHHRSISPLVKLNTPFIRSFVLDPMHLFDEGAVKRFLKFLCGASCKTKAKLSSRDQMKVSSNLEQLRIYIPREFARKPRPLSVLSKWKATELRLFLLYLAPVAFLDILDSKIYGLFLLLHCAARILSSENLLNGEGFLDTAEQMLQGFVQYASQNDVFGPSFVSYNVHSLLHICEDARNFGVLMNFSAYCFENQLGQLKKLIKTSTHPLQQLCRRLSERNFLYDSCDLPSAVLVPGQFIHETSEFRVLRNSYFTLHSTSLRDSYFVTSEGYVGSIKKIKKSSHESVLITGNICVNVEDFFNYPCRSTQLGIFQFHSWSEEDVVIPLHTIASKCMVLPYKDAKVAFPILHSQ